ncbi:hypothetical protein O6H91_05G005600 [Diphasiastrum complanatum]|uniref:Uncharacterized protein n=2 Tax=Diphasiastrum complanatum TaxID=34168 RepID=A0ACC2DKK2_DIPCM|nr:hypothetical protein O6H91_05G004900 [Diphasiastrum complanatum]KAJ7554705.1 hypothetical protein O6H91_05G005600 [Diphasiastrum complanatum]
MFSTKLYRTVVVQKLHQPVQQSKLPLLLQQKNMSAATGSSQKSQRRFLSPGMVAVAPLLFMVGTAVGLGLVTAYRELTVAPDVLVDKKKRTVHLYEIDDPETLSQKGKGFREGGPLRKLAKQNT